MAQQCAGRPGHLARKANIAYSELKTRSVWRYFTLAMPTSSTATCNICKPNGSRGGGSTANFNTNKLIKQFKKLHVKEHDSQSIPHTEEYSLLILHFIFCIGRYPKPRDWYRYKD